MPQLIPAAAGAVASAVSGWVYAGAQAVGFSAATASTISMYAASVSALATAAGITVGLSAAARPQVPDPESGKINRRQSRPPRVIFMGLESRGGGAFMHRETNGSTLGVVLALDDGRLASISKIWLNDDLVTLDVNGWVQEGADGRYGAGDLVQIKTRLGLPTETHYGEMTAKFASTWPTSARGDGCGSLMMLATHRSKESFPKHFPNSEPVATVAATPVCFDWRDAAQDRNDETTWQVSGNPVVWLVHHEWYRCGRSWDRCIEPVLADLTSEADYCDESVAKIGGAETRYAFGGNYTADTEPQARREAILASCDGWLSTNGQGHLVLKVGRYVEPTFTLTGEHIDGYEWRTGTPAEEHINTLVVSYVDPTKDYTETECDPWIDEADVTATGLERSSQLQLTWVQSHAQARRLAKRKMARLLAGRRGKIITGLYGLNGLGHRYIRVQNDELASMADVVVEVMGAEFDPMTGQVVFDVILADTNIDDWNPATEEGNAPSAAERPDPEPLETPAITSVSAFFESTGSGNGVRLNVVGTGPVRDDLIWYVRWRVQGAVSWVEGQFADADPTGGVELETGFVPANETLEVQIAYQTGGGTFSEWGPVTPETVSTSTATAAPSAPTVSAAKNSDSPPDVVVSGSAPSSTQQDHVRVYRGTTTVFAAASDISGEIAASPGTAYSHTDVTPTAAFWRYWATAENASDVASAPSGPVTVLVPYDPAANLLTGPEDFADVAWVGDASGTGVVPVVTANAATAPDGTTTADQIVFDRGDGFSRLMQTPTVVNGQVYKFSVWLRAATPGVSIELRVDSTDGGTLTLTSEWVRYSLTGTASSAAQQAQLVLWSAIANAPATATVEAWGAQHSLA